ncbi:Hint domain-containing protein [Jannaschia ovalis]|uniref:Hint domain-containing protein n=1 Tax=Jannaschia ovalis TaxID=3038773 RepID=A0ABY8LCE9_9RHOB|nr:Hint domain-containing protein [Jannaschia sp. GRR-S6-38]WGH77955.1 Hint domain-containing protein [Jannaschia sp. GRR-S6-38]
MPTYVLGLYDANPDAILSRNAGDFVTWTGGGATDGSVTVFDNGTGGEELALTDGNRSETARADFDMPGFNGTDVTIQAERFWELRDTITGESIRVVQVNPGGTGAFYTLSSQPLVEGREYEVVQFDGSPQTSQNTQFDYADYNDGTVLGTSGDDVIDRDYEGDPNGDKVDNNDLMTSPTEQGTFNWSDYGNNQNLAAGATQTVAGVDVTITSSLPAGSTFLANYDGNGDGNPDPIYSPPGTGFPTGSSARFFANGNATNTTLTIDFDAVAGGGKSTEVHNVQFVVTDIDSVVNGANNFQDILTIDAFDAQGNPVAVDIQILGNDSVSGNTVTALLNDSDQPNQAAGAILVTISGPVERVVVDYDNGGNTQQAVFFSDINFDVVTSQGNADLIDAGAGNDSVFAGSDDDTVLGGTGNDTIDGDGGDDSLQGQEGDDSILGGDGADTLEGGIGADTLEGEAGNDSLDGGDGPDSLSGGLGQDTLLGGAGADTLDGGAEADTLSGGAGDDLLQGGDGADSLDGGDDNDSLEGGAGADTLNGGAGSDTLLGGGGGDSLSGGDGDDSLDGGNGADTLAGGAGNDTLIVGDADTATGGDGDDLFLIDPTRTGGGNLTVTGGETGETGGDTLDLNGLWVSGGITYTNTDDANGGLSGTALLSDGTTVTFNEIESVICFARGTLIDTPRGARAIETLREGDLVLTRDAGPQPLDWVGARNILADRTQAPVRFAPGTIGNARALRVSPQHRILVSGWRAQLLFGEEEVLVPAKALVDGAGVVQEGTGPVNYFHLLTPHHAVIFAEGAEAETFLPAAWGLEYVADGDRARLFENRPELRADLAAYGPTARPVIKPGLSRLLAA